MKALFAFLALMLLMASISSAQTLPPSVIQCGTSTTGANQIPFGGAPYLGMILQQRCATILFSERAFEVDFIGFTSNRLTFPGSYFGAVVKITMGQSWTFSQFPQTNLVYSSQVVFQGPILAKLTGSRDDLLFWLHSAMWWIVHWC